MRQRPIGELVTLSPGAYLCWIDPTQSTDIDTIESSVRYDGVFPAVAIVLGGPFRTGGGGVDWVTVVTKLGLRWLSAGMVRDIGSGPDEAALT